MFEIPEPIQKFLVKLTSDTRLPAYLFVKNDGSLSAWGGMLSAYGIDNLKQDQRIGEQVIFLEGLIPLSSSPLFLPHLQTDNGLATDIYLFNGDEGVWILMLDATSEVRKRKPLQQKAHDLSLSLSELERSEAELLQEKEELETLVGDRTLELARMNLQLKLELQEKQKIENALRESETKFRRLYESNMIGIMFCDANGVVMDANDVFLQMIGYERIDLLSEKICWDEITTPDSRHIDSESFEELRFRGAYTPKEKTFICKDGSQITLLFGAALITGEQKQTVCFALNMNPQG
jgi:PAS domain S-box-containing protein